MDGKTIKMIEGNIVEYLCDLEKWKNIVQNLKRINQLERYSNFFTI